MITIDRKSLEPKPDPNDGWAMFNVDQFLVERVERYHAKYQFACALETGTFKGHTTVGLARMFPRVFTLEINPEFFEIAQPRFDHYPNVQAMLGSSIELLPKIAPQFAYPLFAYLDAHWGDPCPLRGEIEFLMNIKKPKLIMIHDFQVPGRDFGFDTYEGHACNLEYLGDLLLHDECRYAFNHRTAPQSANRGVLFIEHLLT